MTRIAIFLIAIFAGRVVAEEPVTLERTLIRIAPTLIEHCQKNGYKNVGVLKFLVARDGDKEFSDNAGTLNTTLARQLELALILGNDPRETIGIVHNASAVAAELAKKDPDLDHTMPAGRNKLFAAKYSLPWLKNGKAAEVEVDAIISGFAVVKKDLKTFDLTVNVYDRLTNKPVRVISELPVRVTPGLLGEVRESVMTRGPFDGGVAAVETVEDRKKERERVEAKRKEHDEKLLEAAVQVRQKKVHPLEEKDAPVGFDVFYGDKKQAIQFQNGQAFLPEPAEGESVRFVISRNANDGIFGVVLKVNGENTALRQRLPDFQCRKWLLFPKEQPLDVQGYQINAKERLPFKGLTEVEAKKQGLNYGPDVGTISLTVFAERKGRELINPDPKEQEEAKNAKTLVTSTVPEEKSENYHALKASLLEQMNRATIGAGKVEPGEVELTKFDPDPSPIMVATIVYKKVKN